MKSSDRGILLGLLALLAIGAAWFLLLSPKRDQVATLDSEVAQLRTSVDQAEQLATAAEAAKADYASNYHRLVVLGKAAPSDDDTASLFVQLNRISQKSGAALNQIKLTESGGSAAPAPTEATTAAEQTTADAPASDSSSSDSTTASATPTSAAPATEASASVLPLGALVGPAGLPVMPYDLALKGNYFQLADFIDGLQKLVGTKAGRELVDGRLVTIDGFSFTGDAEAGFPELDATLHVTTFVAPAEQGVMAGATPTTPAPTTDAAVPASTTTSTSTP